MLCVGVSLAIKRRFILFSGARETDYPAGEELSESGQVDKASLCGSMTSNSSTETDSLLGGITVVGCSAEGVTAAATSPSTNGTSPVMEKPPGTSIFFQNHLYIESEPIPDELNLDLNERA